MPVHIVAVFAAVSRAPEYWFHVIDLPTRQSKRDRQQCPPEPILVQLMNMYGSGKKSPLFA
jgi:hypothetical protein